MGLVNQMAPSYNYTEIKSASIPDDVLDALAGALRGNLESDSTIMSSSSVWSNDLPMRYSTYDSIPDVSTGIFEDILSNSFSGGQANRTVSLVSILSPLFRESLTDLESVDEIRVVLDASPWQGPVSQVEGSLSMYPDLADDIVFEIGDSRGVPGLQLADMAAYSWGRRQRNGTCGVAAGKVSNWRFGTE